MCSLCKRTLGREFVASFTAGHGEECSWQVSQMMS